jgi:hypothetical protein
MSTSGKPMTTLMRPAVLESGRGRIIRGRSLAAIR